MPKLKKVHKLIQLLLQQKDALTVKELAEYIDVSERTIHNYFQSAEFSSFIRKNELKKIPNVGVTLDISPDRKVELLSKLKNQSVLPVSFNNLDDFTFILVEVFTKKEPIPLTYLENHLYKSTSSIQNIIQDVQAFVSRFSCELKQIKGRGIKLQGKENDIRSLFLFVLTNYLSSTDNEFQHNRITARTKFVLSAFLDEEDQKRLIQLVNVYEKAIDSNVCENDYNLLLLYLLIILIRTRNQFYIEESITPDITQSAEFQYAILLKFHIEQYFYVALPDNEIHYLSKILMSTRKQTNATTEITENKVINEFISEVGTQLNVDLSQDDALSRNLITHLRPAINRMKQGIPFSNPLLDHIKNEYTEIYLLVLTTIERLERKENIFFDSNEIGYICLHIIAALNRSRNSKTFKTALVCNEGLSIELFLSDTIQSLFKEVEITNIFRSNTINELIPENFDLIVNTTNTEINAPNVVEISNLFSQKDFNTLKHFIAFRSIETSPKRDSLYEYLRFFKDNSTSQEEFIYSSCHYLLEEGDVTDRFPYTVTERQQKSSTYVARGIAVLHGSKEEVLRPSIVISNLTNPIEWDGYKVKTVIFIVSDDQNPKMFQILLRKIMRIASSDDLTEELYTCKNLDDVYKLLSEVNTSLQLFKPLKI
ncbi:BglG family transcription antiterminator [Atopococcus tabaci]|uniref:BglG family transcription antiterminator n=1 Tax=Atopococcus tabaci TaxID=269774 RepID=UPI00040070D1|nr:BglG family transcription antiterminator [Atopococcus tabaci]